MRMVLSILDAFAGILKVFFLVVMSILLFAIEASLGKKRL